MKRYAVLAAFVIVTGCASRHGDPDIVVPQTVPPADLSQPASTPNAEARLAEMQTSMTELLERIDVLNERMNKLEAAALTAAPAASPAQTRSTGEAAGVPPRTAPAAQSTAPSRALVSAGVADMYRNGLIEYGRGRFDDARKTFQQVFDADPTGDLADNALYWIGETYFAAGNYPEAMKFYKRVTAEFAEANKAPDALFKVALSFEKTGDLGMARTTLDEVIRRYPYASSAASAKLELKRIKY
ncbi:MAG TPA: tol-pal system protein YbgF [Thermoanaerobaculia bacterium]|jgi:tol-pal system protein YbgF